MYLSNMQIYMKTLNILFIVEGQYHSKDNIKKNYLKMPSSWTFDGLDKRERNINKMFGTLLNHLGLRPNMGYQLKTFKFR